jgi:transposase
VVGLLVPVIPPIAARKQRPGRRWGMWRSRGEARLEVQSLHGVRGRLVAERTALINQLRALMLERGIAVPHGLERLGIDQQSPANRSIAISVKPSTAPIVLF